MAQIVYTLRQIPSESQREYVRRRCQLLLHPGSRCLGLGETFGEIALGEEEIKVKITMKQLRDCRLGGGERWRDLGGVEAGGKGECKEEGW